MSVLYLVRHGQASFDWDNYDALSPLGFQQAERLGKQLAVMALKPDSVITGDMRRHRETAETALTTASLPTRWDTDAQLNEYNHEDVIAQHWPLFGDKPALQDWVASQPNAEAQIVGKFVESIAHWQQGTYAYQEGWQAFRERVEKWFAQRCHAAKGNEVVFTSGGVIAVILMRLWQKDVNSFLPVSRMLANTSVTRIAISRGQPRVASVSEQLHLSRQLITYR